MPEVPVFAPKTFGLEIYRGSVIVLSSGHIIDGRVTVEFGGAQELELELVGQQPLVDSIKGAVEVQLNAGQEVRFQPWVWQPMPDDKARVVGSFGPVSFGDGRATVCVTTHLVNLPSIGTQTTVLESEGWRISLADMGVDMYSGAAPPYALTHLVEISRVDGRAFNAEGALALAESLDWFASLMRAAWVGHLNFRGRIQDGSTAWERWEVTRADPSSLTSTYWAVEEDQVDAASAPYYQDLWAGFRARWTEPGRQETVRTLTTLHIEAASHTLGDAGLVVGVVVLELLSSIIVVEGRAMLSAEGHDRLTTSDRLRLLLSAIGEETSVPTWYDELSSRVPSRWVDGPHAVTEVRNAIVHPSKRRSLNLDPAVVNEARDLAQAYARAAITWWLRNIKSDNGEGS